MKDDMHHFQHIMLCHLKKGKTETHTKKICAECGAACAVTDRKCQKWFAKFLGTTDILVK